MLQQDRWKVPEEEEEEEDEFWGFDDLDDEWNECDDTHDHLHQREAPNNRNYFQIIS